MRAWDDLQKSYTKRIRAIVAYCESLAIRVHGNSGQIRMIIVLVITLLIVSLGAYLWQSGLNPGLAVGLIIMSTLAGLMIALHWSGLVKGSISWEAAATTIGVIVALAFGVASIQQQFRLETYRVKLSIPELTSRLDSAPTQKGLTAESIGGTFRPKVGLFSLEEEGLRERPTVGIVIGVKPSETNLAATGLRLFIEVSADYRLYGVVCPNCDELRDGDVSGIVDIAGEIPSRIRVQIPRIDSGTAVALYPGVASKKDAGRYTLTVWGYSSNNGILARREFDVPYDK